MLDKSLMPSKPSEPVIFVNDEFLPQSQAKISVLDHGLMYGDGCFDAWCGRNGFIFQLDAHLDRLYRSVHALKLDLRMAKADMRANIIETVYRNSLVDFYIKVLVTRGISPEPVIDPRRCEKASVVIFARPTQYEVTPEKKESGIRIKVTSIRRVPHDSLEPKIKSLNYINIVMGKLEAWGSGYDEAVMLDHMGYVCECPGFNILAIQGNKLFTPSHGILVGITRNSVMEMARGMGLEVEQGFYSVYDFIEADEVFMTNTVAGVAPVVNIDGWTIGDGKPGRYTRQFQEIYLDWLDTGYHGTQVFASAWQEQAAEAVSA
jgi:branched-chain amino acid aminotransferase